MERRSTALSTANQHYNIPASCPFTLSQIQHSPPNSFSAWLIREHDDYGEYPHIYAKLCQASTNSNNDQAASVIVLSDTGCGTDVHNPNHDSDERLQQQQPESWNIRTFLEYTINPAGRIPYLVISTHCHYDHILGFYKLLPTDPTTAHRTELNDTMESLPPPTQVLASAKDKSFITPFPNLQKHSLCSSVNRTAPQYTVSTWASDFMPVNYIYTYHPAFPPSPSSHPSHPTSSSNANEITIPTSLTTIHTPGHTPDSLTWYDSALRLICVADSFYTKISHHTTHSPWGPEPPMPTIFCADSDLAAWWGAMNKILGFVRERNAELEVLHGEAKEDDGFVMVNNRIRLCAAHTTINLDAETAILSIKSFVAAILRDEVPNKRVDHGSSSPTETEERWLWDYALDTNIESRTKDKDTSKDTYSVLAPLRVVERGRQTIPKEQWALE